MKHRIPVYLPYDLTVAATETFVGSAYTYDDVSGTGSATGGTVQSGDTIYDEASATGAIADGTAQPSDVIYDT